jgi:hypothetical protein
LARETAAQMAVDDFGGTVLWSTAPASKHPWQRPHATLHGVVFDILVGSGHRVGPAAILPNDDRAQRR